MGGKTLKLGAAIVLLWLVSVVLIGNSYRATFTTKEHIYELGSALQGVSEVFSLDTASRVQRADEQSLDLQLVYALRLQIETHYQNHWFVPAPQQLFFTTDRFIEQTQIYLDNNLQLLTLVENMRAMRAKYRFDSEVSALYLRLSTNILDAIFSDSDSSPDIYRELDEIFVQSETLPSHQADDLQSVLAQVSRVLSSYAQAQYILQKLLNHDVHTQINTMRVQFNQLLTSYVLMGVAVSLLALCLLAGLMMVFSRSKAPASQVSDASEDNLKDSQPEPKQQQVESSVMAEAKVEMEIDFDRMLESLSGDLESVCMLLEVFIEDHTGDADNIIQLLQAQQPQEAQRKAHSLKGVGGNLGAMKLRDSASQVEAAIKSGQTPTADTMNELKLRLDRAIVQAAEFLQRQQ
ncbi:Hpt domain-containing protein [Vibrio sinaloensis]|uniref:Hpt domain-containing protein n=1 Tax=Photobacterium sp. (strain ATCC 43367) TaxID=379097 RepID=UPI00206FF30D|nr:Hpt domain-containing protein [Vibrio sinaloensis]UPQ88744.1 Hpt domain-containing protein [Vibrio sinaloensis]